jgi:hypothetical protein
MDVAIRLTGLKSGHRYPSLTKAGAKPLHSQVAENEGVAKCSGGPRVAQERAGGFTTMRWSFVLVLAAGIAVSACGGSGTGPSGSGSLRMMIKDGPFRDAKALLVTFSQVSVHRSDTPDGSWTDVTVSRRTCDLKRLEAAQDSLGVQTLTSGHYTQVRLVVMKAFVDFEKATTETDPCAVSEPEKGNITIPSGEVKLNREFDVPEGGATTLLLDFDGDRSMHETTNGYMMSPVISVVSAVSTQ